MPVGDMSLNCKVTEANEYARMEGGSIYLCFLSLTLRNLNNLSEIEGALHRLLTITIAATAATTANSSVNTTTTAPPPHVAIITTAD